MNRLQKSAWTNLIVVTVCVVIAVLGFWLMTYLGAKGIYHVFIFIVSGCICGLGSHLLSIKKGVEMDFDERERLIYTKAFFWATSIAMIFLAGICIIPFFVLGGKKFLPVWVLLLIFLITLFITQFVHSAVILIRCAMEAKDVG